MNTLTTSKLDSPICIIQYQYINNIDKGNELLRWNRVVFYSHIWVIEETKLVIHQNKWSVNHNKPYFFIDTKQSFGTFVCIPFLIHLSNLTIRYLFFVFTQMEPDTKITTWQLNKFNHILRLGKSGLFISQAETHGQILKICRVNFRFETPKQNI